MKNRILELPKAESFFLFGARNTGKSTWIKHIFKNTEHIYIDLLNRNEEQKYLRNPQLLQAEVLALGENTQHVVIDEIQKIPALLDVIHSLTEETDKYFILTGSSARKLKHGHANLLAGRALVRNLFPFSFIELDKDFDLETALRFGMLPKIYQIKTDSKKADFLRAYAHTYLKEEVWAEHLIRKLEPFQYFLEVGAQSNGDIINASNIAKDVGVDYKSILQYFSILEDTLIGFHLPAFKHSFRKRLAQKPKFYFFDLGVVNALKRTLTIPIQKGTYDYGKLFEHFIILECYKLANYFYPDYRLSFLRSHEGLEVDLVIERPGAPLAMIEIKSSDDVQTSQIKHLRTIKNELGKEVECFCLCQVNRARHYDGIMVLPWQQGILEIFKK